jgi:hypothetical protein
MFYVDCQLLRVPAAGTWYVERGFRSLDKALRHLAAYAKEGEEFGSAAYALSSDGLTLRVEGHDGTSLRCYRIQERRTYDTAEQRSEPLKALPEDPWGWLFTR